MSNMLIALYRDYLEHLEHLPAKALFKDAHPLSISITHTHTHTLSSKVLKRAYAL
jgi:hypothetical protein